ncbi:MAG TPA: NrfD/PsrC family molybdoenzyme membrane anchor subunit [Chloroflexota bacterium]|nr:NrfD/PsrC family molybdoenzyme membrane anchor subunit [Chloroflexota bacterium]
MLESVLHGGRRYGSWLLTLLALTVLGWGSYLFQVMGGGESSGLSRDVPWGFFIANYTFLVGVAASAVMVVLPYYLHDQKEFGRITALGESLAVAAVATSILFIFVDLGQPNRVMNMILHPTPNSPFFWNMIILPVYLALNLVIAWFTLDAERNGLKPPSWVWPLILISIPWAVSIHTVTSLVYAGLVARPFWNSAVLTPRFLASAFASGPALLLILCLVVRRFTGFDPGTRAIQKLGTIVTYAMIVNLFLVAIEIVVAVYGGITSHIDHFRYLYLGLDGHGALVPWMWISTLLGFGAVIALLFRRVRVNDNYLALACAAVFVSIWIDKGLGMVVGGFVPSPLGKVTEYLPTAGELSISVGVYALGALILTLLYRITMSVKADGRY